MDESLKEADWLRWVEENAPKFLLFARQKARSEADAQDLVQESLAEVVTRRDSDEPPSLSLVFATIQRRAVDLGRRENRREKRELVAMQMNGVQWLDSSVEDREFRQIVEQAMNRMPEIYREVVT